jgi:hypothetical protein
MGTSMLDAFSASNVAAEYLIDAWQRGVLLLDVLRQRGNNYIVLVSTYHGSYRATNARATRQAGHDAREALRRFLHG